MIERKGEIVTRIIEDRRTATVREHIGANIRPDLASCQTKPLSTCQSALGAIATRASITARKSGQAATAARTKSKPSELL